MGLLCVSVCEEGLGDSGQAQVVKEQRHQEDAAESHCAVDQVAVGQLHSSVLPRAPHVPRRHTKHAARQRDGQRLHGSPRGQQYRHPHQESGQGAAKQSPIHGGYHQGQLGQGWVGLQAQLVVEVGGQGGATSRTQGLGCVSPRCAPRVQGEGQHAQAYVDSHDDQGRVGAGQVVLVDAIQQRLEDGQDKDTVEEPSDHLL